SQSRRSVSTRTPTRRARSGRASRATCRASCCLLLNRSIDGRDSGLAAARGVDQLRFRHLLAIRCRTSDPVPHAAYACPRGGSVKDRGATARQSARFTSSGGAWRAVHVLAAWPSPGTMADEHDGHDPDLERIDEARASPTVVPSRRWEAHLHDGV